MRDIIPEGGKFIETANTQRDQCCSQKRQDDVQPGHYVVLSVTDTGIGTDNNARILSVLHNPREK
jgi:signal transduction histidine kinase